MVYDSRFFFSLILTNFLVRQHNCQHQSERVQEEDGGEAEQCLLSLAGALSWLSDPLAQSDIWISIRMANFWIASLNSSHIPIVAHRSANSPLIWGLSLGISKNHLRQEGKNPASLTSQTSCEALMLMMKCFIHFYYHLHCFKGSFVNFSRFLVTVVTLFWCFWPHQTIFIRITSNTEVRLHSEYQKTDIFKS